jgi:hypothetical protein
MIEGRPLDRPSFFVRPAGRFFRFCAFGLAGRFHAGNCIRYNFSGAPNPFSKPAKRVLTGSEGASLLIFSFWPRRVNGYIRSRGLS